MIEQQMVQLAGHHGAKIVDLLSVSLDPLAVRSGHDVDRRRRKRTRAKQLRLFAAHHVEIPVLFNLEAGYNPHAFSNGA